MSSEVDRKGTEDRPRVLLFPYKAILSFLDVGDHGERKYGNRDSWVNCKDPMVYADACARHLFKGPMVVDPDSGLMHCDAVLWNAVALNVLCHREKGEECHINFLR